MGLRGVRPAATVSNHRAPATLVLLPGLDGTDAFFRPLLEALPGWIRPIVITYPPSGANGYDDLLPLVQRAIEGHASVHLLGWSFGGPLALMAAAARPEAVRGIILCASFLRAPVPALGPFRFVVRPPVVAAIRALRRTPALVRGHQTEGLRRAKADVWRAVDSRVLSTRARAALGVDVRSLLAASDAPVLYVASSNDRVIPRHNIDDVRATARACEVVTIEGSHLAMVTNPGPAAAHIARFVQRTG
jgi:pimeloyl-[acyl-carrier protein] methyl ester esterase